jgi:hypothetical protein
MAKFDQLPQMLQLDVTIDPISGFEELIGHFRQIFSLPQSQ